MTSQGQDEKEELKSIGTATMEDDGTIVMRLRGEMSNGTIAHGTFRYLKSDAQYNEVLDHLGGLQPGEVKQVPPWP